MGLDESNLDVTNYCEEHGLHSDEQKMQLAHEIRSKIKQATQLTCSAGIAPNKMLAKICSDMNKPDGQTFLKASKEEVLKFMAGLSIRKVPSIGRMTELILNKFGITTCQDLLDQAPEILIAFSAKSSQFLIRSSLGIARCYHEYDDEDEAVQKSVSSSETFRAINTYEEFTAKILELCQDVAARLEKKQLGGKNITLGWKTSKFDISNKSQMLNSYIWTTADLTKHALLLLEKYWQLSDQPVRLLVVRVSQLRDQKQILRDKNLTDFFGQAKSAAEI